MSLLSKLFGGGASTPKAKPVDYKDYAITPNPVHENGKYRIGALIEKEIDGETKSHTLIRADMIDDLQTANMSSIDKAKQMIDEQGDGIFR